MQNNVCFFHSERFKGVNSFVLKVLAIVLMTVDHASVAFLGQRVTVLRLIGRIAFPIFAFMIAEGAKRTKSREKYMFRLLIFAVVSEVPFDWFIGSVAFDLSYQNVYFTLLFGLFSIWCYELFKEKKLGFLAVITLVISASGAAFLNADYGATGVISIFLFYLFSEKPQPLRIAGFIVAVAVLSVNITSMGIYFVDFELFALIALVPIALYNGERGKKFNKYFFYAFYPLHLVLLKLVSMIA